MPIRRLPLAALMTLAAMPAFAHAPFDMPGPAPTIDQAVALPDAQSTWVIYGLLGQSGQTDFIRLDNLDNDQEVGMDLQVFTRPAYATFTPAFALLGKGLPQPAQTLPFALPDGYGAIVQTFDGDPAQRPISAFGTRAWWVDGSIDVPDLDSGPAYIAVWDPQGTTGEYSVVYNIEPDTENPDLEGKYTDPIDGDGNDDGKLNTDDATLALRMVVGLEAVTPRRLRALDVFPKKDGKFMQGDGKVTVPDVLRLLRRAIGIEPDPFP
jgi:hypothetical protein